MDNDESKTDVLVQQVNQVLVASYPEFQFGDATPAACGLSFLVCRAESALGPLAIRVPYGGSVTGNRIARQHARRLLEQEAVLASHSASHAMPSARVHFLHRSPSLDFLVSDFIEVDQTEAEPFELGRLLANLHCMQLPRWPLVGTRGRRVASMLAARIKRRLGMAESVLELHFPFSEQAAIATLERASSKRCLLHMDVRPENWLVQGGHVAAIVDWENALVGHPALEFARIGESGLLAPELLAGYRTVLPVEEVPQEIDLLYRLDTALLLVLVFRLEVPDPVKAQPHVERVIELHGRLKTWISE